jgi:3-oxoacyl-[acyl-carrier-protein] synthase II
MKALVVAADLITPFGPGVEALWEGILAGRSALSRVSRFETGAFVSGLGGIVPGLDYGGPDSLVMQMLRRLFAAGAPRVPGDARLILASTKGEIDLLEQSLLTGEGDPAESVLDRLLEKVVSLTGARGGALLVSAACTSSSAAVARAASLIRSGASDCVLVVACDAVTEFVYSGFSALMALDREPARPFDRNRAGLSIGEAAAYLLVMSEERAAREERQSLGEIAGWGMNDDANHMTGPSRESAGLIRAIEQALRSSGEAARQVGFIGAHGTGTPYNDAMELGAFRAVFPGGTLPVYSLKGGIGHTMGAAGLVETIIALRALREGRVPPTVNLREPDALALGWVSDRPREIAPGGAALVTNAGFGGVNTALVLR